MANVIPQATPNPAAFKFTIEGHTFASPVTVGSAEAAAGTPFEGLFSIAGVVSVFATANFVTVMRSPDTDWGSLLDPVKTHLETAF